MNKIHDVCGANFLEPHNKECPICGQRGKIVKPITILNMLKKDCIPINLNDYYLCLSSKCDVIYFGQEIFKKNDIKVKVWFKDEDECVPVCYCKDVTRGDIIEHIVKLRCCNDIHDIKRHTSATTGKECLTKNPAGT